MDEGRNKILQAAMSYDVMSYDGLIGIGDWIRLDITKTRRE